MRIPRDFYLRDALEVAKDLLGKVLVHESADGITKGRIVEVEAYLGIKDAASHSYNGRRSKRTEIQFSEGGYAYIYMIYGMHYCLNVVTGKKDNPESILIRAIEPIEGIELMKKRRKTSNILNLTNGPGKLCQAMGISKVHYGADLCNSSLYFEYGDVEDIKVVETKRINVDYAGEAVDYPWRFLIKDNKFVSVKPK